MIKVDFPKRTRSKYAGILEQAMASGRVFFEDKRRVALPWRNFGYESELLAR
ncbi:MAG: hypothetical protein ACI901_000335 [Octadecabacter sp.]|jgi:hypothetical protein